MYSENVINDPSVRAGKGSLAGKVVAFADFLRKRDFKVFQSSIHDALKSLTYIDILEKDDFINALRANLSSKEQEWGVFEELFREFWDDLNMPDFNEECEACERDPEKEMPTSTDTPSPNSKFQEDGNIAEKESPRTAAGYNPLPGSGKKDLGTVGSIDIQIAHLALSKIAEPFKLQTYRHARVSRRRGDFFFPRIMKESLKTDGISLKLYYRAKKKRLKRLVIIADVSGSMDRYTCLLIPFILGIKGMSSRAEAFVFSTSLTPVTFFIRHFSVVDALQKMAQAVPDWSGGTSIGESLRQFSREKGQRLLNSRSVVVILSDGWDLWPEILRRELDFLSSKVYSIIWLNPELGKPEGTVMAHGMRAAIPYIDYLLPVEDITSLKRLGSILTRIMIH